MISPNLTRTRWLLLTLLILGGLLSVSAQNTPLVLPDTTLTDTIQPTPVTPTDGAEWRGFSDPSADSFGLPTEQTGETREPEPAGEWRGSRAPSSPDSLTALVPRDPIGSRYTEAFDFVGAYPWHLAGYKGGGTPVIKIALIDFGFDTSSTIPLNRKSDLTCLSSYPNIVFPTGFGAPTSVDIERGLDMAEVICDIAPDSEVTLYRAKTSVKLYDAIVAATASHQVIVIGADFGASFSPGDGTFGRSDAKDVYAALAAAKSAGVVVVVAAGNAQTSYRSFTYTNENSDISITAQPGDTLDISWSDWDTAQAGGATREDISATLSGVGFLEIEKPARATGTPAFQWIVPTNCSVVVINDIEYCADLFLKLTGLTGDASSVVVQVSVNGIGRSIGVPTSGTLLPFSGTLSRPADSPNVITVGATCADRVSRFPSLAYSAHGPVFATGGLAPTAPGGAYLTANGVKPDVVGPSHITVSTTSIDTLSACSQGFGGTQAAAAHVGAMVALLKQNPLNSAFRGTEPHTNILNYLRTHAIDLPMSAPDGYDYSTGAGLSVLGSPTYDNDVTFTAIPLFGEPNNLPAGACTGADASIDVGDILYVGPYQVGSAGMNGTLGGPLTSLSQAIKIQAQDASGNKCVVVLPGESVSPFVFNYTNGVKIFGYNSIATGNFGSSEIFVNNVAQGRSTLQGRSRSAALLVEDMPDWFLSGFTFHGAASFDSSLQERPQVLSLDNADDATFSNSVVNDFPTLVSTTLIEVFNGSTPVLIDGNSFLDINGSSLPGIIAVEDSGEVFDRVMISDNVFDGIDNGLDEINYPSGSWGFTKDLNVDSQDNNVVIFFTPVLHTLDSYTTIQNNTFTNNTAETLIQFMTRAKDAAYETSIIGNVILNNTIRTFDKFDTAGPLINGFHAKYIYILNNTIANNTLINSGVYYHLMGRGNNDLLAGQDIPWNGSLLSTLARWEIHSNFIYDNGDAPLVGEANALYAGNSGCTNLGDFADAGATHNWVYNLNTVLPGGQCAASLNNDTHPANVNITTINPYPLDVNGTPTGGPTYINGGDDPTSPLYYALTGNPLTPTTDGIDEGYDTLVTGTFSDFATGLDVRNSARRTDGDDDTTIAIDIGAFELTGPTSLFTQTTPVNNAALTNVDGGFTWTPSVGATSYTFNLKRIEGGSPITLFNLTGLTPAADADGLTCTVGCLFNLTTDQKALLVDGGLFRWAVTTNTGILASNAPLAFTLPTGVVLPLLNSGFEIAGANAKIAQSWKTTNKQKDEIRKCGAGFGANGSLCSFQLRAVAGAKANAVKQTLTGANLGVSGDRLILSASLRRKGVVARTATITAKITYTTNISTLLKIAIPAGGSNLWETTAYSNSLLLTGTVKSILVSATIKGKRGMYWIDNMLLELD